MLFDENNKALARGSLKATESSERPEAFKILPPEDQVAATMVWTFYYDFNGADREERPYFVFFTLYSEILE